MKNLLCLLVVCSMVSCKGLMANAGPLPQPSAEFTKASRMFVDAIGPSYVDYVNADQTLNEMQRSNRIAAFEDFEFAVRQVEKARGGQ